MTAAPEFILGFDPGGRGNFGWSVCEVVERKLQRPTTCVASNAEEAFCAVKGIVGETRVLAAGIDAPLLWSKTGNRTIDDVIRRELQKKICHVKTDRDKYERIQNLVRTCKEIQKGKHKDPRVLAVNSLWGSVLVQGALLAKRLKENWCNVEITETHPKALLYFLNRSEFNKIEKLVKRIAKDKGRHKSDATISAYAAWAMLEREKFPKWHDLYEDDRFEEDYENPFGTPVSYWMPI